MRPLLVVQDNLVARVTEPLARAWRETGYEVQSFGWMDGETIPVIEPDWFKSFYPIYVSGSVSFIDKWAANHPVLKSWVWNAPQQFTNFGNYARFGNIVLNNLDTIQVRNVPLYVTGRFHARPAMQHKAFAGGVYTLDEFAALDLNPNLEVAISRVREILAEVRVFIVGNRAVAASQYRSGGKFKITRDSVYCEEALRYCSDLLNATQRIHGYGNIVLDFALIVDNGRDTWKIIESNPINSSGWYDVDVNKVIEAYIEYYR